MQLLVRGKKNYNLNYNLVQGGFNRNRGLYLEYIFWYVKHKRNI